MSAPSPLPHYAALCAQQQRAVAARKRKAEELAEAEDEERRARQQILEFMRAHPSHPLQVSPFRVLDNDLVRQVLDRVMPQDALFVALTCRGFRDIMFARFSRGDQLRKACINMRNPERHLKSYDKLIAARFIIGGATLAVSESRLEWALCLDSFEEGGQRPRWLDDPARASSILVKAGSSLHVLQLAVQHGVQCNTKAIAAAAKRGKLDILRWAKDYLMPDPEIDLIGQDVQAAAAAGGHLAVLEFVSETARSGSARERRRVKCDPVNEAITVAAARAGHLGVLEWLWGDGRQPEQLDGYHVGFPPFTLANAVVEAGQVEALQWLCAHGLDGLGPDDVVAAAAAGKLEMVKHLHAEVNAGAWQGPTNPLRAAAEHGHLDVCAWAAANGCQIPEDFCDVAASNGHQQLLQWARNRWPEDEYKRRARNVVLQAADRGHDGVAMWAAAQGCAMPPGDQLRNAAAKSGKLSFLRWAAEETGPVFAPGRGGDEEWSFNTIVQVVAGGRSDVEMLEWLVDSGCPFPPAGEAHLAAVSTDRLDILQWLVAQDDVPWDEEAALSQSIRIPTGQVMPWLFERQMLREDIAEQGGDMAPHPSA
eukprot:SAG31_NODE_263_length_18841_cov_17.270996_1_plen_594_part_00